MSTEVSPIGGPFELDLDVLSRSERGLLRELLGLHLPHVFVGSGRGGLGLVLDELNLGTRELLIPGYLCTEALLPVLEKRDIRVRVYPVTESLRVDPDAFLSLVTPDTGAVLWINYFGCLSPATLGVRLREQHPNVVQILDNVQAFYDMCDDAAAGRWADYQFCSLSKFFAVPDGGVVTANRPLCHGPPVPANIVRQGAYIAGGVLKSLRRDQPVAADVNLVLDGLSKAAYALADSHVAIDCTDMSEFSHALMQRMPVDQFARVRRENYQFLASELQRIDEISLLTELPDEAVPLCLPVLVADGKRDALREYLKTLAIYCPVHWTVRSSFLESAGPSCRFLADRMLSFPIDQRYGRFDMQRLLSAVEAFFVGSPPVTADKPQ